MSLDTSHENDYEYTIIPGSVHETVCLVCQHKWYNTVVILVICFSI